MKLIAHWRLWWRRASTWLAALNALFVAYVFSQPVLVVGLIGFAPGEWIVPIAAVAALLAFGLPVLVAPAQVVLQLSQRPEVLSVLLELAVPHTLVGLLLSMVRLELF